MMKLERQPFPLLCGLMPDKPCCTSSDVGWHLADAFQFISVYSIYLRSSELLVKRYSHTLQVYRVFQSNPPSFVSGFLVIWMFAIFLKEINSALSADSKTKSEWKGLCYIVLMSLPPQKFALQPSWCYIIGNWKVSCIPRRHGVMFILTVIRIYQLVWLKHSQMVILAWQHKPLFLYKISTSYLACAPSVSLR
jgi:hypothetical protein